MICISSRFASYNPEVANYVEMKWQGKKVLADGTFTRESGDFHKSRNSQMPHSFSKTVKVQQENEVTQFIS